MNSSQKAAALETLRSLINCIVSGARIVDQSFDRFDGPDDYKFSIHIKTGESIREDARRMARQQEVAGLIARWIRGDLPNDVKVNFVPIFKSAYGGFELERRVDVVRDPPAVDFFGLQSEEVAMAQYAMGNETIFAGYGPETKTLVIGKLGGEA